MSQLHDQDDWADALWQAAHTEAPLKTHHGYVGATQFFRHPAAFERILDEAQIIHVETDGYVTVLCGGGSTGEEAHSLSFKATGRSYQNWLRIATLDLSPTATRIAEEGVYSRTKAQAMNAETRDRMFEPFGRSYIRVRDEFRASVITLPSQPIENLPATGFQADISLTAYALMYFTRPYEGVDALAQVTKRTLFFDSWVELGHDETPATMRRLGFQSAGFLADKQQEFAVWRRDLPTYKSH